MDKNITQFNDNEIKLIAGVTITYTSGNTVEHGICVASVFDYYTGALVEQVEYTDSIVRGSVPQLIQLRELPLVINTLNQLTTNPDLYFFKNDNLQLDSDIETYASVLLDKPCIGVRDYGYTEQLSKIKGNYTQIDNNTYLVRTQTGVNPILIHCINESNHQYIIDTVLSFSKSSRFSDIIRIPYEQLKVLKSNYAKENKLD